MDKIVIVGTSELALIMYEYLSRDTRYTPVAFAADKSHIKKETMFGLPVCDLGSLASRYSPAEYKVLVAVGYSNLLRNREEIFHRLCQMEFETIRYVHPDARVYTSDVGLGAFVMPNAVLDVHSQVGANTVVWANCTLAHGSKIGENCWLASGCVISGDAEIGANTFVGINASVANCVVVKKYNIIGANALVNKHTGDYDVTLCGQRGKYRLNSEEFLRVARI